MLNGSKRFKGVQSNSFKANLRNRVTVELVRAVGTVLEVVAPGDHVDAFTVRLALELVLLSAVVVTVRLVIAEQRTVLEAVAEQRIVDALVAALAQVLGGFVASHGELVDRLQRVERLVN